MYGIHKLDVDEMSLVNIITYIKFNLPAKRSCTEEELELFKISNETEIIIDAYRDAVILISSSNVVTVIDSNSKQITVSMKTSPSSVDIKSLYFSK